MLSKGGTKLVHRAVDNLFDKMMERLFGWKPDKTISITHRADLTLPSLYQAAARSEGSMPDATTENSLMSVAQSYLEAQREHAKATVVKDVNSFLSEAKAKGVTLDVPTVLGGTLSKTFEKISSDMHRIVDSEAQNGRAMGTLEGIVKINAQSGIDDPNVYFVIVRDDHVCKECLRLHQLHGTLDGPPRIWKLSEIGHGYHKRGDFAPKIGGLHPHCRCSLATLMPGYGFDGAGQVTYKKVGYDEYEEQRGMDGERWVDDKDLKKADGAEAVVHTPETCAHCADSPTGKCANWKPKPMSSLADQVRADMAANPVRKRKPKKVKPLAPPALVAVHNLSEANFHHAHELGGLAAPSLAVAHKDYPFGNFGDITLVADPKMVDPATTPVFDADIYSPRHPRAKTALREKSMREFAKEMAPHSKLVGASTSSLLDEIQERGVDSAIEHRSYSPALKAAYLHTNGHSVEQAMRPRRGNPRYSWAGHSAMNGFLDSHPGTTSSSIAYDSPNWDDLSASARAAIHGSVHEHPEMSKWSKDDQQEYIDALLHDHFDKDGKLYFGDGVRAIGEAQEAAKGGGEPDTRATEQNVESKFAALPPELQEAYEPWARSKLGSMVEGRYIPKHVDSANGPRERRIPYTLENILKEVTKTIRQGENFNYGLGTARAAGAKRFRNLDQIKAARDRLVSAGDMDKAKTENEARWEKLVDEIRPYHNDPKGFYVLDGLASAIGDSYKKGKYLHRELKENGFNDIPADLHRRIADFASDLVKMPTEYFEAKPQRIVHFGEFRGAAVPHDARPETIKLLRDHGIDVETYPKGDADARWAAVRRLSEAKKLLLAEGSW